MGQKLQPGELEVDGEHVGQAEEGSVNEVADSTAQNNQSADTPQPPAQRPSSPHEPEQRAARGRLAPGGLRQMVLDHLQAHPGEAFTATKISRVIDRSSGAIANALVTLTKQGLTENVSLQPLTYRLATTHSAS